MKPIYIYALRDPRDWRIRYVGKTNNPRRRFLGHCRDKSKGHRGNWLQSVIASGHKPVMEIMVVAPYPGVREETKWISICLKHGLSLVNMIFTGSPSPSRGKPLSEEHKKKISASEKGQPNKNRLPDRNERLKIGRRVWASSLAPEALSSMQREKSMCRSAKVRAEGGRRIGKIAKLPENREEVGKRMRSWWSQMSDEDKRLYLANRGRAWKESQAALPPEKRRKGSHTSKHTEESKRKMSEATKRWWSNKKAQVLSD